MIQGLLAEVVGEQRSDTLLLDNTEMLFDPGLQLDPLRLLQQLSRNRSVVASWAGGFDREQLTYAVRGHTEYRQYTDPDTVIVSTEDVRFGERGPASQAAAIMESA